MIRKFIPLIILISFFTNDLFTYAQAPGILWNKKFGGNEWEYGNAVLQTDDNGFIAVGLSGFVAGELNSGDLWLIRTDEIGDTLWTRTYGGSANEEGYSIIPASDAGYILAGKTSSYGSGSSDGYIIKINSGGDTLWTKTYGGTSDDYLLSVKQTADTGYILLGHTYSFGLGSIDIWLVCIDNDGDTLWSRTFGTPAVDLGYSVQHTIDGGFIIGGRTLSPVSGAPDLYLIRTNARGDTLWTRTFNGPLAPFSLDEAREVHQLADQGFLVAGRTQGGLWVLRTDSGGDTLRTMLYNGDCSSMERVSGNGFIISGSILTRIDENGDTLWTKSLEDTSNSYPYSVQQTSDGGFILTGRTNNGNPDLWLLRIEADAPSVDVKYENTKPLSFELLHNYPNPFNPSTKISFTIPAAEIMHASSLQFVTLKVYDILGNELETLVNGEYPAGTYEVNFNAAEFSGGIYFYKLQGSGFSETRKMMLLK